MAPRSATSSSASRRSSTGSSRPPRPARPSPCFASPPAQRQPERDGLGPASQGSRCSARATVAAGCVDPDAPSYPAARAPGRIRRYEAGDSQPNLAALRNLALALSVSTDALVFDDAERGPDDDLRLQFEATSRLDDEGKTLVKALLEAVLLRQEARRWTQTAS